MTSRPVTMLGLRYEAFGVVPSDERKIVDAFNTEFEKENFDPYEVNVSTIDGYLCYECKLTDHPYDTSDVRLSTIVESGKRALRIDSEEPNPVHRFDTTLIWPPSLDEISLEETGAREILGVDSLSNPHKRKVKIFVSGEQKTNSGEWKVHVPTFQIVGREIILSQNDSWVFASRISKPSWNSHKWNKIATVDLTDTDGQLLTGTSLGTSLIYESFEELLLAMNPNEDLNSVSVKRGIQFGIFALIMLSGQSDGTDLTLLPTRLALRQMFHSM